MTNREINSSKLRIRLSIVLLVTAILLLAPPQTLRAQDTGANSSDAEIVVLTKPITPFVIRKDGRFSGFSIDLWRELAERSGIKYRFEYVETISELLAGVENGNADAAIAAVSITATRENKMDFSHTYFHSGLRVLTHSGASGLFGVVKSVLWSVVSSPIFYAGFFCVYGVCFHCSQYLLADRAQT